MWSVVKTWIPLYQRCTFTNWRLPDLVCRTGIWWWKWLSDIKESQCQSHHHAHPSCHLSLSHHDIHVNGSLWYGQHLSTNTSITLVRNFRGGTENRRGIRTSHSKKKARPQGMLPHVAMLSSQGLSFRPHLFPSHLPFHPLTPRSSTYEGMHWPQRKRRNKSSCKRHREGRTNSFLLSSDPTSILCHLSRIIRISIGSLSSFTSVNNDKISFN